MNCDGWSWIGACSVGTSHIKSGTECQDRAACVEYKGQGNRTLVAVVSDGAGSAKFSSIGSSLVVRSFAGSVVAYLRSGGSVEGITADAVRIWLDEIRDKIAAAARNRDSEPREFAATLVAAIISESGAIVCHIGDGACVIRRHAQAEWEVPSWPAHGEYASSTYFVTDDPQPNLQFSTIAEPISEIAIFSDGLERLALDFTNIRPSEKFFNPIFAPLSTETTGRNRTLSKSLRAFLDGPQITSRTDDDKSLLLARRA